MEKPSFDDAGLEVTRISARNSQRACIQHKRGKKQERLYSVNDFMSQRTTPTKNGLSPQ